jgi:hypothetical protein
VNVFNINQGDDHHVNMVEAFEHQISLPSSSGQEGGPSFRQHRFESGREHQHGRVAQRQRNAL